MGGYIMATQGTKNFELLLLRNNVYGWKDLSMDDAQQSYYDLTMSMKPDEIEKLREDEACNPSMVGAYMLAIIDNPEHFEQISRMVASYRYQKACQILKALSFKKFTPEQRAKLKIDLAAYVDVVSATHVRVDEDKHVDDADVMSM